MRVIFEEVDNELFFEVILTSQDLEHYEEFDGIVGDFFWEMAGEVRQINVFIRKEKENELCHSNKVNLRKLSPKISPSFVMLDTKKNKVLPSLYPKRAGVKKRRLKKSPKKGNNEGFCTDHV